MALNLITKGTWWGIQAGDEIITVVNTSNKTITLLHTPIANWMIININWLIQDVLEYNILWNTITLWNNIILNIWDIITVKYFY